MSQLASPYTVQAADVNGNVASAVDLIELASDGTVYIAYEDGLRQAVFRIPLANVESPDNLSMQTGNVFMPTSESGPVQIGFPGEGGLGEINSGALEQSTVDIASEFTDMIDAQRGYTANSKVFQTGAELMDVLVNLKR
jgi:flagellar hook protein FlgE